MEPATTITILATAIIKLCLKLKIQHCNQLRKNLTPSECEGKWATFGYSYLFRIVFH